MPGLERETSSPSETVKARLRRIREDLRTARRRCEDVVRLGCDWFWEIDRQLRVVAVSERVMEAVDFPATLVIGQRFDDLIVEPSDLVARLVAPEVFTDVVAAFVAGDGATRRYRLSGVPVFDDETGAFRGFRGIATRVTLALPRPDTRTMPAAATPADDDATADGRGDTATLGLDGAQVELLEQHHRHSLRRAQAQARP